MYVLDDPVDYNLDSSRSLGAVARRAGVDPAEYAYDVQLQRDGRQLIYTPLFNFAHGNLDAVHEMITSPVAMFGLSDAGAHCGQICDGSMTTTYLSLWARDRRERRRDARRVGGAPDHPAPGRPLRLARPGRGRPPATWPISTSSTSTGSSAPRRRSPPTCRPAVVGSCRRPRATAGR